MSANCFWVESQFALELALYTDEIIIEATQCLSLICAVKKEKRKKQLPSSWSWDKCGISQVPSPWHVLAPESGPCLSTITWLWLWFWEITHGFTQRKSSELLQRDNREERIKSVCTLCDCLTDSHLLDLVFREKTKLAMFEVRKSRE